MNFARRLQPPFLLDKELPAAEFAEGLRPTITAVVRNPAGGVLILFPRPAYLDESSNANMFMLPQDKIGRHETPRNAIRRLLRDECLFADELLDIKQAVALGVSPIEKSGSETKTHHIVFISLRRQTNPILNHKNRAYLFAEGPNFLWAKISGCRPEKRKMIVSAVCMAVELKLLCTSRWRRDRVQDLLTMGALR
jgi:hypothetical protein